MHGAMPGMMPKTGSRSRISWAGRWTYENDLEACLGTRLCELWLVLLSHRNNETRRLIIAVAWCGLWWRSATSSRSKISS